MRAAAAVIALIAAAAIALASLPASGRSAAQAVPVDLLAEAQAELAIGRNDEAAARFLDLLTGGPVESREAAWSGLIRARAAVARNGDAVILATALLRHDPVDVERVRYLLGRAAFDAADYDRAATAFRSVAVGGGPLAPLARLRSAQALAAPDGDGVRRDAEAAPAFDGAARDRATLSQLRVIAWREGAEALIRLDRVDEAYDAVSALTRETAVTGSQIASARWLVASVRLQRGDPLWNLEAAGVLVASPGAPEAALALDALLDGGVEVPLLEAAYVRYRARDDDAARALYEAALETPLSSGDKAIAQFYLGAIAERDPDADLAIDYYGLTIGMTGGVTSSSYLADDALWWRALLLEERGDWVAASTAFRRLARDFPTSPFAARAAIRDPLAMLRGGLQIPATIRLRELTASPSRDTAARATGWLAVIDGDAASGLDPATFDPTSIATILQLAGDEATAPLPAAALDEWITSPPDSDGARLWLQATIGGRPVGQPRAEDDGRLVTAIALVAAGEREVARSTLFDLRWSFSHSPHDLLEIAIEAREAGLDDVALSAAASVLALLTPQQRLETPRAIEQLAYPLLYGDDFRQIAVDAGVPPLLLLALVRQESAFNPDAVSFADAIGLTQVIAPTGQQIANSLGVPWRVSDLLIPERSLRFGATYLADQIERFDGDIFAALSAYNGGPHNADRWLEAQWWPGAAGYIATIDFAETRRYVERVIEQYAWYRHLYAGAAAPAIR